MGSGNSRAMGFCVRCVCVIETELFVTRWLLYIRRQSAAQTPKYAFCYEAIRGNLKKSSSYLHPKMLKIFFEGTPSRQGCSHFIGHNIYEKRSCSIKNDFVTPF